MVCHRCGSDDCQIINEVSTSGKDFSAKGMLWMVYVWTNWVNLWFLW